jgi:L-histidine N-alpha-methyltransferase
MSTALALVGIPVYIVWALIALFSVEHWRYQYNNVFQGIYLRAVLFFGVVSLLMFLGGTLGNYTPGPRATLLAQMAATLRPGEWLLLGTDLVKDTRRLVNAYDDSAGVTAAFNLNVLTVVNRELDADFDVNSFRHVAVWNDESEWIEMRLRAEREMTVRIPSLDLMVPLIAGEEILTEVSAKFRRDGITSELAAAGFEVVEWWTDPADDFALSLSRRTD